MGDHNEASPGESPTRWEEAGVLLRQGNLEHARQICVELLEAQPQDAVATHLLGLVAYESHLYALAETLLRRAVSLAPTAAAPLCDLGLTLYDTGRLADAERLLREALILDPRLAPSHTNLAKVLEDQGRLDEAVTCFRQAAELDPDDAAAFNNLGILLQRQEQVEEAEECYARAIALDPGFGKAHNNLGTIFHNAGKLPEAIVSFQRAIAIDPNDALAHHNLALALLTVGDFEHGWAEYEWRWQSNEFSSPKRDFEAPLWTGDDLKGRRILLHAEQGFGDTLQFMRYVPLIVRQGAPVIFEVPLGLQRLLEGAPDLGAVVSKGETLAPFDTHCPLMSLPCMFGTTLDTIPPVVAVPENPAANARWAAQLPRDGRYRVGVVCSGNPTYKMNKRRALPPAALEALLCVQHVELVSLQPLHDAADADAFRSLGIRTLGDEFQDFADTAAAVGQLDLVITVDTAVAHLAGTLGKPVWLLLSYAADWRWLLDRDDSPWYPTMRLFRQGRPGDWGSVLTRVAVCLKEAVEAASS